MVRCKLRLNTVTERIGSKAKYDATGKHVGYEDTSLWDAEFSAVYSDQPGSENKAFWDSTPSGTFKVSTIKQMPWTIGKEYYFDITEA